MVVVVLVMVVGMVVVVGAVPGFHLGIAQAESSLTVSLKVLSY